MRKNITFSADEELIKKAREKALREESTLNQRFREWLERYVQIGQGTDAYESLMEQLSYVRPGRTFNRDELNER